MMRRSISVSNPRKIANFCEFVLKKIKRNQGSFARNTFILGFGTCLSQLLNIISTPILGWYYSPESFGLMATTLSVVYICASLSNINYDAAIIFPEKKETAFDLLIFCIFLNFLCSFLIYLILTVAVSQFEFFSFLSSPLLALLLSLGVFFMSTFNSLNQWAVRVDAYGDSSASQVIRTLSALVVQLIGIFFNSTATWLIGGRLFGLAPAVAFLVRRQTFGLLRLEFMPQMRRSLIAARNFWRFPLYAAPQKMISLIAEELPTLTLATFFGPTAAGLYWFSNRLLQMPCGVISHAIGRVFYRESAKKIHQGHRQLPGAVKIVVTLSLAAILPVLMIVFWSHEIFEFFLGPEWQTAADYAQWIVIWTFFRFSISPINSLFNVLSEQRLLLKLDGFVLMGRVAMIAYCALQPDALSLVIALSIFESMKITIYGMVVLRLAWMNDKKMAGLNLANCSSI
ncbi:MAG: lipopolysaccharide biosynthesis protein [Geminicoccaceae bacterium]